MRAATVPVAGGPDAFVMADVPDPTPSGREVVIRVRAAGVNRADALQRDGRYPAPLGAPTWPGLEVAGDIAAVGDDVDGWRVGDSVAALVPGGGYAELVAVDARLVLPAIQGVTYAELGAVVEASCTVWSAFADAHASAGQVVLVHGGSGGVGTAAIMIAKGLGMTVVATAGSDERARRCAELGADIAVNYRTDDVPAATNALGGAHVILDVAAGLNLVSDLTCLARDGTIVVLALQGGGRPTVDLGALMRTRGSIVGTTLRSRPLEQRADIVAGVRHHVWPLIPTKFRPVIHAQYPLDRVSDAHRDLESGRAFGKIVLMP